jgi:hypothetical protein
MSVTEGKDKPLKYPTIFNSADVAVITKMDLLRPWSLTLPPRSATFNPCGRAWPYSRYRQSPAPAWKGFLGSSVHAALARARKTSRKAQALPQVRTKGVVAPNERNSLQ